MIHDLLVALGWPIRPDTALGLYTAVHTDTGSFRYSNTTPRTFRIAAALTAAGAQPPPLTHPPHPRRPQGPPPVPGGPVRRGGEGGDGPGGPPTRPRGAAP